MKGNFVIIASVLFLLASCTAEPVKETSGTSFLEYSILVGGKAYRAADITASNIAVVVPEGTDLSSLVAEFSDNAKSVTVGGVEQESGVSANDFSSLRQGVVYRLKSDSGSYSDITVQVFDSKLPAISIVTAQPGAIADKTTWRDASLRIIGTDGNIQDLGGTGIRGRGNWTWDKYPKKPYALKLDKKQEVLGMPAHKRWVLLAQYRGFIGNPLMFEATRRAPSMDWAPRGYFVELILNGKYNGLYYLCEQIKKDENRVNIASLKDEDVAYPAVSGGYLLEYDELYDEKYKFMSSEFHLPVQLKGPNDSVPDAQFNYIRNYINEMEVEIKKIGSGQESHYYDYMDIDSFADYWMILETIGNYEAYKPRSVKMYKGRDGVDSPAGTVCKLKAGPLWDQELFEVYHQFNSKDMYYYKYLFKDPEFVNTVKSRWPAYKSNLLGNEKYISFVEYLNQMVDLIQNSARRDIHYWGNGYFTLSGEYYPVKQGFVSKIEWMDQQIQNF